MGKVVKLDSQGEDHLAFARFVKRNYDTPPWQQHSLISVQDTTTSKYSLGVYNYNLHSKPHINYMASAGSSSFYIMDPPYAVPLSHVQGELDERRINSGSVIEFMESQLGMMRNRLILALAGALSDLESVPFRSEGHGVWPGGRDFESYAKVTFRSYVGHLLESYLGFEAYAAVTAHCIEVIGGTRETLGLCRIVMPVKERTDDDVRVIRVEPSIGLTTTEPANWRSVYNTAMGGVGVRLVNETEEELVYCIDDTSIIDQLTTGQNKSIFICAGVGVSPANEFRYSLEPYYNAAGDEVTGWCSGVNITPYAYNGLYGFKHKTDIEQ